MQDELFEVQNSPSVLSDFLAIKSAGKQISLLDSVIQPTMDVTEYFFPVTSVYNGIATGSTVLPLIGGRGIYRIRGTIGVAGDVAFAATPGLGGRTVTTGGVTVILNSTAIVGTPIAPLAIARAQNVIGNSPTFAGGESSYSQINNVDFIIDLKTNQSETAQSLTIATILDATVSNSIGGFYLTAQRIQ